MMTNIPKQFFSGCPEWRDQIPALIELPHGDDVRAVWENHAANCPACLKVLNEDLQFQRMFLNSPQPGRAHVANSVLEKIRQPGKHPFFRPIDIGLGLAGTIAGVVLGFQLSTATLTPETISSLLSDYEEVFVALENSANPDWASSIISSEEATE